MQTRRFAERIKLLEVLTFRFIPVNARKDWSLSKSCVLCCTASLRQVYVIYYTSRCCNLFHKLWCRCQFKFKTADNWYGGSTRALHLSSTRNWNLMSPVTHTCSVFLNETWCYLWSIFVFFCSLLTADTTLPFTCRYSLLTAATTYDLHFVLDSLLTAGTPLSFTCLLLTADTTYDLHFVLDSLLTAGTPLSFTCLLLTADTTHDLDYFLLFSDSW